MRRTVAAFGILMLASLPAAAQNVEKAPPGRKSGSFTNSLTFL